MQSQYDNGVMFLGLLAAATANHVLGDESCCKASPLGVFAFTSGATAPQAA